MKADILQVLIVPDNDVEILVINKDGVPDGAVEILVIMIMFVIG
jgi:hypothetical protein